MKKNKNKTILKDSLFFKKETSKRTHVSNYINDLKYKFIFKYAIYGY